MNLRNLIITILFILTVFSFSDAQNIRHPNVLLIVTDDQGYGDLGINGNPHIKTPTIDQFAKKSIRFNKFYVSPVCAPTRSSLMTGRFSLRTGVRDTYNGGATMAANETTIAEMLKKAGYSTGIFGKWHLGDNYPSRPNDQGFDESVIHLSGGMGQVGDFTTWFQNDSSYFNPVLWHNGAQEKYTGYCTDIFAQQAINFIEKSRETPFFCYLAFNAPHTPLQVPDKYYQKYKDIDPASGFENDERPFVKMNEQNKEDARRVYAMVENIDDNLAKIFDKLNKLGIDENTIVLFMTDNGPQQIRYIAGMRGRKGSVYRGGVRVLFYFSYPEKFKGNKDIEVTTAHIDIFPTLAEICGAEIPKDRIIDGKSLLPLINDQNADWTDRQLFFYWTRRYPELYNNISVQEGNLKLVGHTDYNSNIQDFELFDIQKDPYEQNNIIIQNITSAEKLKAKLDNMYQELIHSENILHPPHPVIGTKNENPVFLNRNDADGERGIWDQEEIYGEWYVKILEGNYNIRFKFIRPVSGGGKMVLETGPVIQQKINTKETDMIEMRNVYLSEIEGKLIPFYSVEGKSILPFWVEMERIF